ncbi:MAG: DNA-processing protein DprA [Prevotellaceae bacterium]|nr:DNA-processing protein DprA [Candidatus Faecinaster equi]
MSRESVLYSIALTAVKGISSKTALTLYKEVKGDARKIFDNCGHLDFILPNFNKENIKTTKYDFETALERAKQEIIFIEKHDIKTLCYYDDEYPIRMRNCCDDAPIVLYYKGNASLNAKYTISIVGTRHCTDYGKDMCRQLTEDFSIKRKETLIVSGLAYGIDINAHRGALKNGLQTVAVLAHGLDRIYPTLHRDTAKEMLHQGGLLTEYMSGTNPDKPNFLQRNRIIAAISDACIVVESAYKGGAMSTARCAMEYNHDVFAFPGRKGDEYSSGCNDLIKRNTAALITDADDVIKAMGWPKENHQEIIQTQLFAELSDEEQSVINTLKKCEGITINQLVLATGLPIFKLSAMLNKMEMLGMVISLPGSKFRLPNK